MRNLIILLIFLKFSVGYAFAQVNQSKITQGDAICIESNSTRTVSVLVRIAPILGFTILLTLHPGQYGVMFTTVPIYIFYYIVFGFIGKCQRSIIGPSSLGAAHGVFLAFAFAATNPIFSS